MVVNLMLDFLRFSWLWRAYDIAIWAEIADDDLAAGQHGWRVAMTQATTEVLLVPLTELDHADMPRPTKDSLRKSIIAIAAAYAEDDDPRKVAPDAQSFTRLVKFLEHPHRWPWEGPALALSPEGNFSAIWDRPGVHRWILDFPPDGKIRTTHLQTYPDGRIDYVAGETENSDEIQPPFAIG